MLYRLHGRNWDYRTGGLLLLRGNGFLGKFSPSRSWRAGEVTDNATSQVVRRYSRLVPGFSVDRRHFEGKHQTFQLLFVSRLKAGSPGANLGVYFEVILHTLFSRFGLPVLGLIVAIFLVSRTAWGKRAGVAMLCAVGYLLYLAFLYGIGATQGADDVGYGWLALLAFTLPWSFLFDPMAGQGLHVGGAAGMILNFALLVGVYGTINSLLFLSAVWIADRFMFSSRKGMG
jgi:hypothetical protein